MYTSSTPAETLADQEEYKEWIKAVEDPFNQFRALIHQVIIKWPPGADDAEIDQLNMQKEALKAKVGG